MFAVLASAYALFGVGAFSQAIDSPLSRKVILVGWDMPSSAQFRRDHALFDRLPFDGTIVDMESTAQGPYHPFWNAMEGIRIPRSGLSAAINNLRSTRPARLRHNFLGIWTSQAQTDFFDDDKWRNIVDAFGTAAWAAKQSGFTGLVFDPEHYGGPGVGQWTYRLQPSSRLKTFAETYRQARERGKQVGEAIGREYGDITILSLFSSMVLGESALSDDPMASLETNSYGLLAPFLDGLLEALPSAATFIDGNEQSYSFNDRGSFMDAANLSGNLMTRLTDPSLRSKRRQIVQTGFAMYLDAYGFKLGEPYAIDPKGLPVTTRFGINFSHALQATDEYLWVYGEEGRWWPMETLGETPNYPTWEERFPGLLSAMRFARNADSEGWRLVSRQASAGTLRNLVGNAGMAGGPGSVPNWFFWQHENSSGTFGAGEAAWMRGVSDGCFGQIFEVVPGKRYAMAVRTRLTGKGTPYLMVRWKLEDGRWNNESLDVKLLRRRPAAGGWSVLRGAVMVPEGSRRLVVLLCVQGQNDRSDVVEFDDCRLHALDPE
jgi:hypothetical protein